MNIGTKIKNLRRDRGITQEELAEMLGITSRAVSQWECERTAPDISQLPILARIFGVTTDHLLGVDIGQMDEEISAVIAEAEMYYGRGDFEESVRILRGGLAKYPASHRLMVRLADILPLAGGDSEEIENLCLRVISESTNRAESDFAHVVLLGHYKNSGKVDTAVRMAEGLSYTWNSREDQLMHLLEGEAAVKNLTEYVEFCGERTMISMLKLADISVYTDEEKLSLYDSVEKIAQAMCPMGDMKFIAQFPTHSTLEGAKLYAKKGDYDRALAWLRRMVDYAREFDRNNAADPYISPAIRGVIPSDWIHGEGDTFAAATKEEMIKSPEFYGICDREEYRAILRALDE